MVKLFQAQSKRKTDDAIANMQYESNQTQLQNNAEWHPIYSRLATPYTLLLAVFALAGYVLLLCFPVLIAISLYELLIAAAQFPDDWPNLLVWVPVLLISSAMTRDVLSVRFPKFRGVTLQQAQTEKIRALLEKLATDIKIPTIHKIVIGPNFELDIHRTPLMPIPTGYHNTLILGLPMLQSLSCENFHCALTRKLLQFHQSTLFSLGWLSLLREVWPLYRDAFKAATGRTATLWYWLFAGYSRMYRRLSTYATYLTELKADRATLEFINDEDVLQTIEAMMLCARYFKRQYWPKMKEMQHANPSKLLNPYSKLESVVKNALSSQEVKHWLDDLYAAGDTRVRAMPSLKARMDNIGRSRVRILEKFKRSAANLYLADHYNDIIDLTNRVFWETKYSASSPKNTRTRTTVSSDGTHATVVVTPAPRKPTPSVLPQTLNSNLFK